MDPNLTWYAFSDPEFFGVYVTNDIPIHVAGNLHSQSIT